MTDFASLADRIEAMVAVGHIRYAALTLDEANIAIEALHLAAETHNALVEPASRVVAQEAPERALPCHNCSDTKKATYFSEQSWSHEVRDCHLCRAPGPALSEGDLPPVPARPAWHELQDRIDTWAQQTLPADHAAAIMSWSDRLARHLAPVGSSHPSTERA